MASRCPQPKTREFSGGGRVKPFSGDRFAETMNSALAKPDRID
jgi:hypothetical protein